MPLPAAPSSSLAISAAFLRANDAAYEWLVETIQVMDLRKEAEAVLGRVILAARFAARFHAGRFADGAIENLALKIGMQLGPLKAEDRGFSLPVAPRVSRRRVLHVASVVYGIGGHTRMLYHWVRNDRSSCHSVVLLNQRNEPIPRWLYGAVQRSGGDLMAFPPGAVLCDKAKWLREMARRSADLVVLHHHPFDVLPTVAFAKHEGPPVALVNHADHQFWLGSSVSDLVINLRAATTEHAEQRRFVSCNTVLPIPLADPAGQKSRWDARRELAIPEDRIVLLSVGHKEKYRPCGAFDFVATAGKILDRQPGAHMYVVGESAAGIAPYLNCALHERLHFVGSMEDPSLYRAVADVYLESFPFGSQTALLEAALCGLAVVPAYAPLFPLLVANDDTLQDLLPNAKNEQEFIERAEMLIGQPEQRLELGRLLRGRLLVDHVGQGWLERLAVVYQESARLTHNPQPIPTCPCGMTDSDIGLSLWHVMADGRTNASVGSTDEVSALLGHSAAVSTFVGDYVKARRFAWRTVQRDPYRVASWYLLAVTVLAKTEKFIRRVLRRICTDVIIARRIPGGRE
jgi:glycosyltransferase involved in cell wall biosynthesis